MQLNPHQLAALRATAREFSQAQTPPGWIFNDSALALREQEVLFGQSWLCVGHHSRLAKVGDYFVVKIGKESIILVASGEHTALTYHAFYNVCRHRGTRLVSDESGSCQGFLCPYHAWNYALDGRLLAAPGMHQVAGFEAASHGLRAVRLATFYGFLFINLRDNATSLADTFNDFPDFSRLHIDCLQRVARHDYHVATNWKMICQNYNECYHCALAHPKLHKISASAGLGYDHHSGRHFTGGPMGLKSGCNTLNLTGKTSRKPLPGTTEEDQRLVCYFNLYPNFLLTIAPDYLMTHYLWPTSAKTCYVETEWFCAPEQIAEPGFSLDEVVEFWDETNRQDWTLCENAMFGLESRGHQPGRYHPLENCVHEFDSWYVRRLFANELTHT